MLRTVAISLAIAALLQSADAVAQQAETRWSGPWDLIAFEVLSWGHPVTSWRLLADGSGSWTEAFRKDDASLGDYRLVWHEFTMGEDAYRQVEKVLSGLPDQIPDFDDCSNRMSDLPYGTLRLTRGAMTVEIDWNSGCLVDGYREFIETLKAADTLVAACGRAGRVLRIEEAGTAARTP